MLTLSKEELDYDYALHYSVFSENDTTEYEKHTFYQFKPQKEYKYLNYGCGVWSRTISELREEGYDVYGFDPYAQTSDNEYVLTSYEALKAMRFDGIFSNNVLEHLQNPLETLMLMKSLLKDDHSKMIHSTPCYEYLYEYTRFHLVFFTGHSLEILCRKAGLTCYRHSDEVLNGERYISYHFEQKKVVNKINDTQEPGASSAYVRKAINKGLLVKSEQSLQSNAEHAANLQEPIELNATTNDASLQKPVETPVITQNTSPINSKIDVSDILPLQGNEFTRGVFLRLLEREPSLEEYCMCNDWFFQGISTAAIVHLIASSPEFGNRAQIVQSRETKRAYNKFRIKKAMRRIPFLGRFLMLLTLPNKLELLDYRISRYEKNAILRSANIDEKVAQIHHNLMHGSDFTRQFALLSQQLNTFAKQSKTLSTRNSEQLSVIADAIEHNANITRVLMNRLNALPQIADLVTDSTTIAKASAENLNILPQVVELSENNIRIATICSEKLDGLYNIEYNRASSHWFGGPIVVKNGGFTIAMPSEEWRLAIHLFNHGHFEHGTEKFFQTLLRPDMVVVDVGANLGIYTLHAAKAGCQVHSFEPTPTIFSLLRENLKANEFEGSTKIHLYEIAAAEEEKIVDFHVCQTVSGHNSMLYAPDTVTETIKVKASKLDSILSGNIDIVKIDVEGAEQLVLQGMTQIINNNPQIKIIIEYAPENLTKANVDPQKFFGYIKSLGFEIHRINEYDASLTQITEYSQLENVFSVNLFLKFPEKIRGAI